MNNSKAIILSAGPNGLGALRSLYKENIRADVITANKNEPVMSSRLPIRKVVLNNAGNSTELLEILLSWPKSGQVLLPTSDWYVDFLVANQEKLSEKFKFVLPKGELSSKFIDKKEEIELVNDFVELPKTITVIPESKDDLLKLIVLPIIIKPRSNELNRIGQKNILIYSDEELDDFYAKFHDILQYCIVQDIIVGDDENLWVCNCVFDLQGNLINAFTFQRLQLTPPHFGVTCYAESRLNDEVIRQVKKLGKGVGYVGPAMVEFKVDDRDGKYKYIEVNPRLGLCNYFDSSCGKNNVYATYCVAMGLTFVEQPQKGGRMFLSFYEDLYSRFRDGQKVTQVFKTYFSNAMKMHTFMYFSWSDPWPALVIGFRQWKRTFMSVVNKISNKPN
jgi:predicted ATP-grasp superfamily ATP-dependent carboligase